MNFTIKILHIWAKTCLPGYPLQLSNPLAWMPRKRSLMCLVRMLLCIGTSLTRDMPTTRSPGFFTLMQVGILLSFFYYWLGFLLSVSWSGPFTQLVWHSSQKFGCGKARSRSGKVIVVAYYEPRGNIPEQFHDNVLPPVQEESSSCDDNDIENSFTITEINDKHDSSKPPTPSISKRHLFFNLITCK